MQGGYKGFEGEPTPPPPDMMRELKAFVGQGFESLLFYATNPGKVQAQEWGFLSIGLTAGVLSCLVALRLMKSLIGVAKEPKEKAY